MIWIILGGLFLVGGITLALMPSLLGKGAARSFGGAVGAIGKTVGALSIVIGIFFLASTSFVSIDADRVGHLKRIYGFSDLPEGRIIATDGQKGPQAEVLGPGFHFRPFINVLFKVEEYPVVTIPEGYYGELVALDGAPMPDGMFIAPAVADDAQPELLNAESFLKSGKYYRGPQETVLKPGSYRLNRYLFNVRVDQTTKATVIPVGFVGVVKSNVQKPGVDCTKTEVSTVAGALSVPLVDEGCVGIWRKPLEPGAEYLNRKAYEVTLVETRVKTWVYKGGFTKRIIDLSVDQGGNIKQVERQEAQPVPDDAADRAVFVKVEGWDIPQELRALVQVSPENAPIVVGAVGGLDAIEDRILTPAIRSIVRNVAGSTIEVVDPEDPDKRIRRRTKVLDLIENRDALEQNIEKLVKREGLKAGVDIQEIRLGEPAVPPELLVSRLREQLADQLSLAYARETQAQEKRIETEQARATANEQPRLVAAQIAVKVANQRESERAALGRAEKQFLEQLALGQEAQANVLGKDRVALLQALEKTLTALERKPELVSLISRLVPHTVVGGDSGGGLAGAAAIFSGALGRTQSASAVRPTSGSTGASGGN
ncbi:MAG: SPFH domain-containing protein [Pseudomonadota bacterium]